MAKKNEMSLLKAWLIITASLLDDVIIFGLILLGLWLFHVEITWVLIVVVFIIMAVFVVIMHKAVVPAIRRRVVVGVEGMIGTTGWVTETLKPAGMIKIKSEYWQARAAKGTIETGEEVEVVEIDGLCLEVKKKQS
jgi:membrane-bound ClpP family serine protease